MNPVRYVLDGYRWLVNPYGFLDAALRRRGLTFRVHLPVLGDVLMTGDPRLIAEIRQHRELSGGLGPSGLGAILGRRSLIMLDGDAHAARHRLVAPLFRGPGLAAHDELTVRLTREAFARLPRGRPFSLYAVLRRIGLKVMVRAMFGERGGIEAEDAVERFLGSFRNPLVLFCPALRVDAGPYSPWGRAVRNRRAVCDLIRRHVRAGGPGLVSRLAAGAIGEDDMVEEVLSLLLFGHDTAAATMAWAFAHIYGHAAAATRVREEARTTGTDRPPDPDALPFLTACIKESMRLCPVVVHVSRTATADVRLGGFDIPRGRKVIPCTYLAQHNPAVFPDPYAFRPERFLSGRRFEHAFFPFGFGNRTCVGEPFAMRQMLLVIATASAAGLELVPGYWPGPVRQLVLIVPRGGTVMRRRPAEAAVKVPVCSGV
jgi:cytochrome P450